MVNHEVRRGKPTDLLVAQKRASAASIGASIVMEIVSLKERVPSDAITSTHRALNYSVHGTSKGAVFIDVSTSPSRLLKALTPSPNKSPTLKKPQEITISTSNPVTKVQVAAERWDCIIALAHSRIYAIALKTLQRETLPLEQQHSSDVLCFAVDESSDRLVIGTKRKILVKKHSSALKFEPLFHIDLDDPCQDLGLAVENGHRWICLSCWENTVWHSAELDENKTSSLTLSACDFIQTGRSPSELLLCKANTCTFASPNQASSSSYMIRFSDTIWQVVLVGDMHYLVAALKNANVEVALDTGELLQSFAQFAVVSPHRHTFTNWGDDRIVFSASKKYMQCILPTSKLVLALLAENKPALALAVCSKLVEEPELLQQCKVERAYQLLQTRPSCSMDDIEKILALNVLDFAPKFRFLRLFGDTDVFDSPQHADKWLSVEFPNTANNKKDTGALHARFQPGVFNYALQHIFLPLLLDLRRSRLEAKESTSTVDSILLRALVLVRNPSSQLALAKQQFFSNNECSVEESESLLLRFPEMWEDHAALLNGKGLFEKGVEWLSILGKHSTIQADLEKYAKASMRMLSQERPEMVLSGSLDWILQRVPQVGVEALVSLRSFSSVSAAKEFFHSKQLDQVFKPYLQCLVNNRGGGTVLVQARNELAELLLQANDRAEFLHLVSEPSSGAMNFESLVGKLDKWPLEQSVVLDRLGRRNDAAFTLATKCTLVEAERYAIKTEEENVFGTVFDGLVVSRREQDAIEFLAKHADRLDCTRALGKLPNSMVLGGNNLALFRSTLMNKLQVHRDHQIEKQLLRTEHFDAMQRLASEQAKYTVLSDMDRCQACNNKFNADNPVLVYQSRVWHYTCYYEEQEHN